MHLQMGYHLPGMFICYLMTLLTVWLLLLPAAFWLLLSRAKKVETEVAKLEQRQAVLSRETKAEKSLRVLTLMVRAVPLLFLLIVWPLLSVWSWIPNLAPATRDTFISLTLGLQLVCVLLLQVMGAIRSLYSFTEHTRAKLFATPIAAAMEDTSSTKMVIAMDGSTSSHTKDAPDVDTDVCFFRTFQTRFTC